MSLYPRNYKLDFRSPLAKESNQSHTECMSLRQLYEEQIDSSALKIQENVLMNIERNPQDIIVPSFQFSHS